MLYEPEAIGVIEAYSPTRKARVYEPEAAPEGLRIEMNSSIWDLTKANLPKADKHRIY